MTACVGYRVAYHDGGAAGYVLFVDYLNFSLVFSPSSDLFLYISSDAPEE